MEKITVSTKQLRQDFGKVVRVIRNGQSLLLLYRSRPLANIEPVLESPLKPRTFSQRRLRAWLNEDSLSRRQSRRINEIIKRLP